MILILDSVLIRGGRKCPGNRADGTAFMAPMPSDGTAPSELDFSNWFTLGGDAEAVNCAEDDE